MNRDEIKTPLTEAIEANYFRLETTNSEDWYRDLMDPFRELEKDRAQLIEAFTALYNEIATRFGGPGDMGVALQQVMLPAGALLARMKART